MALAKLASVGPLAMSKGHTLPHALLLWPLDNLKLLMFLLLGNSLCNAAGLPVTSTVTICRCASQSCRQSKGKLTCLLTLSWVEESMIHVGCGRLQKVLLETSSLLTLRFPLYCTLICIFCSDPATCCPDSRLPAVCQRTPSMQHPAHHTAYHVTRLCSICGPSHWA
jgi:hypothetical protein